MVGPSHTAQVLIVINCAQEIFLECVLIALSFLNAVDGCGPQATFNTVAEILTLTCAHVAMGATRALLEIVGRGGQNLGRKICLLNYPL